MPELPYLICWRTSGYILRCTRKRLRYFFIEEWVRAFFVTFPVLAAPTLYGLWRSKAALPWSLAGLLQPMGLAATVALFWAGRNLWLARRHIESDYELNGRGLRVQNRARTQTASWEEVWKWELQPHPYAAGTHMLRVYFVKPLEPHGSRHLDLEVDPVVTEVGTIEAFFVNRLGFRQTGYAPAYEPL